MIVQWDAADRETGERLRSMDVDSFVEWLEADDGRLSFDVDKAWHAVHFTLAGDPWTATTSLGSVVLGGEEFGEDLGYGPARWLSPEAVVAASQELVALSAEDFASRLDFAALTRADIYPQIWERDPDAEDLVEYVVDGYREIRDRFAEAAAAGLGFVISLS